MKQQRKIRFKGQINTYVKWPLWLSILLAIFNIGMFFVDVKAGFVMLAFLIVYIVVALILYYKNKNMIISDLINFATHYGQVQRQLLRDLEIPYVLLDETGKIIWTNEAFENTTRIKNGYKKSIMTLIPEIQKEDIPVTEAENEIMIMHDGEEFRVNMRKVVLNEMMDSSDVLETLETDSYLIAMFMFDETRINTLQRENDDQKLVVGLIYLDNYDEALESIEEVRRSLLVALIDRKINKYFSSMEALVKKLDKDKYLVVFQKRFLKLLIERRFDILEDVKTVNIGNEMAVTLSIGIGVETGTYIDNYESARQSIDLALGRGGDQAVVKNMNDVMYYGGKTQVAEKNTRVKARVKAHALREIIEGTDKIIVMGHKLPDVDSFGAAIGVYRAAKTFGKKTHIVINEVSTSVRPLMDRVIETEEYEQDIFLNSVEALEVADENTAVIIVDTNKPSYTECEGLLSKCKTIVVIDHHRQGTEKIENATLSYIEPYASSACEMVAEIIQYISDTMKIRPAEADCIYSGMMIDTDNFLTKTGVRTFEAAAYLRRNGADVTRVRKMFRDSMEDYKVRAEIVRNAEVYGDNFAISVTPEEIPIESPTIIGAQAANELLNINGIKASFVLTAFQNQIYISARSIDEINVQVIMERLGGGGHLNIAGTQIGGVTSEEAKQMLINTIDSMIKDGDL
ncbi:MAG: DHH family phosphoesterase [Lachnospiraceae bacterium]|nr:DHH family phosphoesterase [Lachnospiraceae bacterium]